MFYHSVVLEPGISDPQNPLRQCPSQRLIQPNVRCLRRIEAAPDHAPYGNFCVAPGHQIGFNDLKAIEIAEFVRAIDGQNPEYFSFRKGLRIQLLVESIQKSAKIAKWVDV